jgi:hypothetical protein
LEVYSPKNFVRAGLKTGSSLSRPFKERGIKDYTTIAWPLNFLIIAIVITVLRLYVVCYLAQKSPGQSCQKPGCQVANGGLYHEPLKGKYRDLC